MLNRHTAMLARCLLVVRNCATVEEALVNGVRNRPSPPAIFYLFFIRV